MQIDNNIYSQKIHYFLTTKYFVTLRKDLTTVHQHKYNKHCQQNNILISKHRIKHLTQFSATPSPYCCWSLWWTSADGTFSPTRSLITMRCSTLRGTFCSLITLATPRQVWTGSNRAGGRVEVVASLSQGRTAAAQCGLFTYKSVPVIFEPPCICYW